jgi:diacylglycerol O-acyltransferase / wax synthase
MNVAISNKRAFATLSLPLQEVKSLGKAAGGSLNDAVLGVVSGGLRRFLESHDELPKKPLVCAMPVSLRSEPHQGAGEIENQSSMVLTTLASDIVDPVKRLQTIIEGTQRAKQLSAAMKTGMPTDIPSLGIPWLMTGLTKLYTGSKIANRLPPVANVVVSNVPGPPIPLFMAGAQLSSYYPVSIVVHGIALNITLQSYHGQLYFGLIACAKALPDVAKLATFLEASFQELKVHFEKVDIAPSAAASKPARKAKRASSQ